MSIIVSMLVPSKPAFVLNIGYIKARGHHKINKIGGW